MDPLKELQERVQAIEERNQRVELDKRWETSFIRKGLLLVFTYLAVFLYFIAIDIKQAYLHAVVPTIGFLLSTLTLPFFKKLWSKGQKE